MQSLLVGLYFRKLLQELRVNSLAHESMFRISTGLFLHFVGYLHIALFSNYVLRHYSLEFNRHVWAVYTVLFVVLHGCYCVALGLRTRPA